MILIVFAVITFIMGIAITFFKQYSFVAGYINLTSEQQQSKTVKMTAKAAGILCFFITGILIFAYFSSSGDPNVTVTSQFIKIDGSYGITQSINEIKEVSLKDSFFYVLRREHGSSLGPFRKGEFTVDGYGKGRIYINKDKPPFIYITTNGSYIFINYSEPNRTRELYQLIRQNINK